MQQTGQVQNGVVVFDGGARFPEGTRVCIVNLPTNQGEPHVECPAGELPLVRGGLPGSVTLTNERVAEILEEEDIEAMKGMWNVPS